MKKLTMRAASSAASFALVGLLFPTVLTISKPHIAFASSRISKIRLSLSTQQFVATDPITAEETVVSTLPDMGEDGIYHVLSKEQHM